MPKTKYFFFKLTLCVEVAKIDHKLLDNILVRLTKRLLWNEGIADTSVNVAFEMLNVVEV